MEQLLSGPAYRWGQFVAWYLRRTLPAERVQIVSSVPSIQRPAIWMVWHRLNLLGLASWRHLQRGPVCRSFVTNGLPGDVARGWVEGSGFVAAPLPPDYKGNPRAAVRLMLEALNQGEDVIIAVDGPHGPAEVVRPGAPWLARMSNCPLIPVGLALAPGFSVPRWDRLRCPLPGARMAAMLGEPVYISRKAEIDAGLLQDIARRLNESVQQAEALLRSTSSSDTSRSFS